MEACSDWALIKNLKVFGLRNLVEAELSSLDRVNVLYGENGAGKTSFLEAINILGAGRTFRDCKDISLISSGKESCSVIGILSEAATRPREMALGVKRKVSGGIDIRLGGRSLSSVTELLGTVPVQVLNADSFRLLSGEPAYRRRYLDWGVFHVEHAFFPAWRQFQRCLKQRNSLLKSDNMLISELDIWTEELASLGEAVSGYRHAYFLQLAQYFSDVLARIAPNMKGLKIEFYQGWGKGVKLIDAMQERIGSDMARGFTHVGPQRADLKLTWDGRPAADTLSRGQQKLVVCSLKLAQGVLQVDSFPGKAVYLIDDLPSELDPENLSLICHFLADLDAQIFITSVLPLSLQKAFPDEVPLTMFHVEQGRAGSAADKVN